MTEPTIGTVLGGKFVVEGVLGRGGMGVVYSARHQDLDQRVAIKCLLPDAQAIPQVVERFAREARAAAKIQGEHVARVIDVGRFDDGTPYIVMEHLEGHDLSQELAARGRLPVEDAVRYVLESCEALAQAHAHRIVHRDLKPANLFLAETPGRRPIIKVLDFGISKVVDPDGAALTKTATVMGTPYYMSPEQLLSSKSVDARSDIWALGVILYELISGLVPFAAETAPEIIAKIVQNTPEPVSSHRADLPAGLDSVIRRCLRTSPAERYPDVAALAEALLPFAGEGARESVTAIAGVLGATETAAPAATPTASPMSSVNPAAPTLPADAASMASPVAAIVAVSATAPSVTLSSPQVGVADSSRRLSPPLVLAGGAVLAAAVAAGALLFPRTRESGGPDLQRPGAGLVGGATLSPSAAPTVTPPPAPPVAASASATPKGAPSSAANPAPSSAVLASPHARPTPPAHSPAVASSSTAASHNPLDLHLK